jgi:hypothetical protein
MKVNNLVQSIVGRYEVVIVTTSTYLEMMVWFWWKKVEKGKRSMLKWTSWFPRVHLFLSTLSIFFPFYQTTSPTFPCFFDFIRRRIHFVTRVCSKLKVRMTNPVRNWGPSHQHMTYEKLKFLNQFIGGKIFFLITVLDYIFIFL